MTLISKFTPLNDKSKLHGAEGITMKNMSMKQSQHKKPSTSFSFFQMVMILMMLVDALLIVVYVII